jgi:hypothetical protein
MGHDAMEHDTMGSGTGQRSCSKMCLSGHFFLDLCSLSLEEGALRLDMPT